MLEAYWVVGMPIFTVIIVMGLYLILDHRTCGRK
jgi:hypothetical protein